METKGSNENVKSKFSFTEIIVINTIHIKGFMTLATRHILAHSRALSQEENIPKYYFYALVCSGHILGRDIMNI